MGGRLTLINSSLSQHVIVLAAENHNQENGQDKKIFFWQAGALKKKYHLVKWSKKKKGPRNSGTEENESKPAVQMVVEVGKGRRAMANNS